METDNAPYMATYNQAKAISRIKKVWYQEDYPVGLAVRWNKKDASEFIGAHSPLGYNRLKEDDEVGKKMLHSILKEWRGYDPLKKGPNPLYSTIEDKIGESQADLVGN